MRKFIRFLGYIEPDHQTTEVGFSFYKKSPTHSVGGVSYANCENAGGGYFSLFFTMKKSPPSVFDGGDWFLREKHGLIKEFIAREIAGGGYFSLFSHNEKITAVGV